MRIKFFAPVIWNCDFLFIGLFYTQFYRETIRIVQLEQISTVDALILHFFKFTDTFANCLTEGFFFFDQHRNNFITGASNFWEIISIDVCNYRNYLFQEVLLYAKVKRKAYCPAH